MQDPHCWGVRTGESAGQAGQYICHLAQQKNSCAIQGIVYAAFFILIGHTVSTSSIDASTKFADAFYVSILHTLGTIRSKDYGAAVERRRAEQIKLGTKAKVNRLW